MARVKLIVDKEDVAPEHHVLNAFEVAPAPDAELLPLGSGSHVV